MRTKVVSDPARVVLVLGASLMAQGESSGHAFKKEKSNTAANKLPNRLTRVALVWLLFPSVVSV